MADNVLVCWRNKRKEGKRQDRPDNAAEETMREGGEADDRRQQDFTQPGISLAHRPSSLAARQRKELRRNLR